MCVYVLTAQSCPTRCNPMDCNPSGSMGFPRQECWSGLPFPSSGDLPESGIKTISLALAGRFLTTETPGKPVASTYYLFSWSIYSLTSLVRYLFHEGRTFCLFCSLYISSTCNSLADKRCSVKCFVGQRNEIPLRLQIMGLALRSEFWADEDWKPLTDS